MRNFDMTKTFRFLKKIIRVRFEKRGYRIFRPGPYMFFDFESFLYRHLEVHENLTYIQIGANDGVLNDPIYQFVVQNHKRVTGYLIEPVPEIYQRLVENYAKFEQIQAYNFAIHESEAEMKLYRVSPESEINLPKFAKGIASFDKDHWQKTLLVPGVEFMEAISVPCMSLKQFISREEIEEVDLLIIDTEGYDFEILKALLLAKFRPRIIRFEHGLRNNIMTLKDFMEICGELNSSGYQIIAESYDATAYLLDPNDLIF